MRLGEYQKLKVIKKVEFGVYLAEHEGDETRVLLPQKQVPADAKLGDETKYSCTRIPRTASLRRPTSRN